jgi:RHS repeat-associated protein
VDAYSTPINYQTSSGWLPIDNTISPDPDHAGWLHTNGNDWTAAFGPSSQGVELVSSKGRVTLRPVVSPDSSTPDVAPTVTSQPEPTPPVPSNLRDLKAHPMTVGASTVDYADVWPGVSVDYEAGASRLKENIVLRDPQADPEVAFDVIGAGLSPTADGGLALTGPLGDQFVIPAPTVATADGSDVSAPAGVRYEIRATDSSTQTTRVAVVLDQDWRAQQPASSYPLTIDPSFVFVSPTSAPIVLANPSGTYGGTRNINIGRDASGRVWRSALRFNYYEQFIGQGYEVYEAGLTFTPHATTGAPNMTISVYNQGAQPSTWSQIGATGPLLGSVNDPPAFSSDPENVDVSAGVADWLSQGLTGQWFGFRGNETGTLVRDYDVRFFGTFSKPPAPSVITSIADGQVLSSTTPTLHAQRISGDSDGHSPVYIFQVTTSPAPGAGSIVSSGNIADSADPQWQVPQGALQEGVTYYAWVLTQWNVVFGDAHQVPPTLPDPVTARRSFTVNLGLGDGGPSPTDSVGSAPGKAKTPAEGAPSPGVPASKLTVNLVDGNLSASMRTTTMGTLSGGLALNFTYNSLTVGSQGLRGEYFNDTNGSGAIDSGDVAVGERTDPTIGFDWGYQGKPVAAQDPTKALARWSGYLNVPTTGTWQVGAISSDGLRATIDGTLQLDQWTSHEPESTPVFGSSFTATAGTPIPILVEWRNTTNQAVARVFLKQVGPDTIYPLSPAWLTRAPRALPDGWTFNADAGSARWVGLRDQGTSVSLYAADGTAHEFKSAGNGAYTSPSTAPNDLLTAGDNGRFVLRDAGGSTYTFRAEGTLESLVSAGDDRNPAALVYSYSGSPVRLRTITDPVSNRTVTLSYGGDAACSGAPAAAAGLLCNVAYWDGTTTTLTYDTSGRFIRLTNPGAIVTDFMYDTNGRLTDVRDPLTNDAIAAGIRADDATARTQITYDSTGRVATVTQPSPTVGAARPTRTYTYDTVNRTGSVSVAGFTPTVGFAERTTYDTRNRITATTGSDGLSTTYGWDLLDRLVAVTDTAGLRTTTFYDYASRPATTYGPAPVASFQGSGLPVVGANVPTTAKAYDQGIVGLAAAYWTNPYLAGGPALHDTGLAADGSMDRDWGTTPPVTPGTGGWSARYSGVLNVATAGSLQFSVNTKGSLAKVWVDGVLVADDTQPEPASGWTTATGTATALAAGPHRIRVDMVDTSGPAGLQVLWNASGSFAIIAGSSISPNYGLLTSTTDPDGKVTATEYRDTANNIGPHYGLKTATVSDPSGLNLRTTTTYEAPGAGSYLRRVARTLPAGNVTTTENYGGTEGPVAAVCGVSAGTLQAGMPKRVTSADPDGAGPAAARVEEFVYDTIGRQVGRRVGTTGTIASAGWACTGYDARGRMTTQTWPAHGTAPARTVTYSYAVGGNPLVSSVAETSSGTVTAAVDLLDRTITYTDVWGATTTTTFDQPGRMTSTVGPMGTTTYNYDGATGRSTTTAVNGVTLATPSYNSSTGRLSSVAYGNGTNTALSYDNAGRTSGVAITDATATTGETLTYSLGGRVTDQQIYQEGVGLVDGNPSGANYIYDSAGRLTTASLPGTTYTYGYGASTGCTEPNAGLNTNRSTLTVTGAGAGTTNYCYNHADQLESTSTIAAGQIAYDDHGNTTQLGGDSYQYDAADNLVRSDSATTVKRYVRDPLGRIADRVEYKRITYVATTSATSGGSSVTVNQPAGAQAGDVVIGIVSASAVAPAVSPGAISVPGGWGVLADKTNANGRGFLVWHTVTATDPTTWTFTVASGKTIVALAAYRNVEPRRPIMAVNSTTSTASTTHPLPVVGSNTDTSEVINAVALPTNSTATPPAGVNQRAQITSGPALLLVDREQNYRGNSSALNATTGLPAISTSFSVALTPTITTGVTPISHINTTSNAATTTDTVTLTRPTGTQPGDAIVASITAQGAVTPGAITAAGWSMLGQRVSTGTLASAQTYVLFRYATAADPNSWTFQAANATDIAGALSTYRGPDTGWPIDALVSSSVGGATTHPFPTVTTSTPGHYLVHVLGVEANTTITAPAGTTQRANRGIGIGATGVSLLVADRAMPDPGTSTPVSATTGTAANSASLTVVLMPAIAASHYSYSGHTDNPQAILYGTGTVADGYVSLPGQTTYTLTPGGALYAHHNVHGDTVTVTGAGAARLWSGFNGPYGETTSGAAAPDTSVPSTSWGYLAEQQRLTDGNLIHMGARPYSPSLGRFLGVDPLEGGCANDYTYVSGDPLLAKDTNGRGFWEDAWDAVSCVGKVAWSMFASPSSSLGNGVADLGEAFTLGGSVGIGTLWAPTGIGGAIVMDGMVFAEASTGLLTLGTGLTVVGVGLLITGVVLVAYEVC